MSVGPIERRITPWLIALTAVLLVGVVSYTNARGYLQTQRAVREALSAREAANEVLSLLKDVETGARGFMLTSEPGFLEPYSSAREKLPRSLEVLARVGELDAELGASARRTQQLATRTLSDAERLIALGKNSELKPLDVLPMLEGGKRIMDEVRVEVDTMNARTDLRLDERERATKAASFRLSLALGSALCAAVLITLAGLSGARREAAAARRTSEQLARDVAARKNAEQSLREQTRLLESVLENIDDGVAVMDRQRKLVVLNPAASRLFPYQVGDEMPDDWVERGRVFLPDGVTPFPAEAGPLTRAIQGEPSDSVEMTIVSAEGSPRSYAVTTRPIAEDGEVFAAVAVYRDTTEDKQAERRLLESEQRYRVLSEASFDGVVVSRDGVVVDSNETFAAWVGRSAEDLLGMSGIEFFAPDDRERVQHHALHEEPGYEAHLLRADGTRFPVEVRGRFITNAGQRFRIATVRDITEKKRKEAELETRSELLHAISIRDELTGLYNRRGFMQLALEAQSRDTSGAPSALFFADLNGMKVINDKLGHEMGDHAIVAAAKALTQVFGPDALVARLGGDEFAVFVAPSEPNALRTATARLEEAVSAINAASTARYRLSISMGVATNPPHKDIAALMQAADAAMYEAKRLRHQRRSLRVLTA